MLNIIAPNAHSKSHKTPAEFLLADVCKAEWYFFDCMVIRGKEKAK